MNVRGLNSVFPSIRLSKQMPRDVGKGVSSIHHSTLKSHNKYVEGVWEIHGKNHFLSDYRTLVRNSKEV